MATEYPYMISNNKIKQILDRIEVAEKPNKFSYNWLKTLGISSSNDRAIIPLLKRLGFLRDDGTPTEYYDQLKDKTRRFYVLGERVKALYSDLYGIDTSIHSGTEDEIKGAIGRVTRKDAPSVNRYYHTFKKLTTIAKFGLPPSAQKGETEREESPSDVSSDANEDVKMPPGFHYNIQNHLPATSDISVYNAIFKSLKENLGI